MKKMIRDYGLEEYLKASGCDTGAKFAGEVGTLTSLKDSDGNHLSIGDVVKVVNHYTHTTEFLFVQEGSLFGNKKIFFVQGYLSYYNSTQKDSEHDKNIKVTLHKSHKELKIGESYEGMTITEVEEDE